MIVIVVLVVRQIPNLFDVRIHSGSPAAITTNVNHWFIVCKMHVKARFGSSASCV